MTTLITFSVLIWVIVSATCLEIGFPGKIKKLVGKSEITTNKVAEITKTIFSNESINCEGIMELPTENNLHNPPDDCDKSGLHLLRSGFKDPDNFDFETFLAGLWCSKVGAALISFFKGKKVNLPLLKDALIETWFKTYNDEKTPFARIFLRPRKDPTVHANSWYTYTINMEGKKDCRFTLNGEKVPVMVTAQCEDENYPSKFIYVNTFYTDFISYTLCTWATDRNQNYCLVSIPGGNKKFRISTGLKSDDKGTDYLYSASPDVMPQ